MPTGCALVAVLALLVAAGGASPSLALVPPSSDSSDIDFHQSAVRLPVVGYENCDALLVWAHGLGDIGSGWRGPMQQLITQTGVEHFCVLMPTAPKRVLTFAKDTPHAVSTAWFDLEKMDGLREAPGSSKPSDDSSKAKSNSRHSSTSLPSADTDHNDDHSASSMRRANRLGTVQQIRESGSAIARASVAEARKLGIPMSRVVVGGFSQGAVVALHAAVALQLMQDDAEREAKSKTTTKGRRVPKELLPGGVVVLGGFLGGEDYLSNAFVQSARRKRGGGDAGQRHGGPSALVDVPIRLFHGGKDDVVNVGHATDMLRKLKLFGAKDVTLVTSATGKHGMNDELLGAVSHAVALLAPRDGGEADL